MQKHRGARVGFEKIFVYVHESPEQTIPDGLPFASGVIAHFPQVIQSADVGFSCKKAAICKLAHAVYIGHHYPIVGIYEQLHKPLIHLIRLQRYSCLSNRCNTTYNPSPIIIYPGPQPVPSFLNEDSNIAGII